MNKDNTSINNDNCDHEMYYIPVNIYNQTPHFQLSENKMKEIIKLSDDAICFYGQKVSQCKYESKLIYKTFFKLFVQREFSKPETPSIIEPPQLNDSTVIEGDQSGAIIFSSFEEGKEVLKLHYDYITINGEKITENIAEVAYLKFTEWLQAYSKNFPSW